MPKAKSEKIVFYGTGRRKSSIARVRLVEGSGVITINGKNIDEYFGAETLKVIAKQPLTVTNTVTKYDVKMQKIIETDDLIFIKPSLDLVEDYLIMANDKEVQKYISKSPKTYTYESECE